MGRRSCRVASGGLLALALALPPGLGFVPGSVAPRFARPLVARAAASQLQGKPGSHAGRLNMVATDDRVVAAETDARVAGIKGFLAKVKQSFGGEGGSAFDPGFLTIFDEFLEGYTKCAIQAGTLAEDYQMSLASLLKFVPEAMKDPYQFELFHKSVREPIDMYAWGNDFFRPLVEFDKSKIEGLDNLKKVNEYVQAGHNVFLLSNHQTEADPQVCSLLMEREGYAHLAEKLINVAGHRVTTDPLAIPFSMGRNLFCIFSKKYMENPPEEKSQKQKHNMRTLKKMADMMGEGGQFIWVAPSGGRDRPDPATGDFVVTPFDPKSVEVFRLMAKKNAKKRETHFFPFAMWTNKLVPPPDEVNKELGERRQADRGPVSIAFGDEVVPDTDTSRAQFCADIEGAVKENYARLDAFHATQ